MPGVVASRKEPSAPPWSPAAQAASTPLPASDASREDAWADAPTTVGYPVTSTTDGARGQLVSAPAGDHHATPTAEGARGAAAAGLSTSGQPKPTTTGDAKPAVGVAAGPKSVLAHTYKLEEGDYSPLGSSKSKVDRCSLRLARSPPWAPPPVAPPAADPDPLRAFSPGVLGPNGEQPGALGISWVGPNRSKWNCQFKTVAAYCAKHGYALYSINDTDAFLAERNSLEMLSYWLKVQALRKLLLVHPWVLHIDTDVMFPLMGESPPVHQVVPRFFAERDVSLVIPNPSLWNTDSLLVKGSDWGRAFVERAWALGRNCPHCLGEQGALALASFHAMVDHMSALGLPDQRQVGRYEGASCCLPSVFCRYPLGRSKPPSPYQDRRVMFCVGHWVNHYTAGHTRRVDGVLVGHPNIVWYGDFRERMRIKHPAKTETSCECFKRHFGNESFRESHKRCRDWPR